MEPQCWIVLAAASHGKKKRAAETWVIRAQTTRKGIRAKKRVQTRLENLNPL